MCVVFSGILTGWLKTQLLSLSGTISFITRALSLVDYKIKLEKSKPNTSIVYVCAH